jgi:chloride channel protein, CIC family
MERYRSAPHLILATLFTGLIAGLGAVGFHYLADTFGELLFSWAATNAAPVRLPFVVLVPTIGLALVGIVLQYFPAGRLGGVGEVLESLERHAGVIPFARILNVILSGLVLAFGGSVGPEGPMVQMGALAGSLTGRAFGLTGRNLVSMVRAGAAAGISSAFRSPAGGVLLTLEVFGARFNRDLTSVAVAAGIGYLTRTIILGDAYPFRPPVPIDSIPLSGLLIVVPLMGLVAAPTGHLFIRMFQRFQTVLPSNWPLAVRVTVGGFLVGVIGIWYPQVMSAGYPVIKQSMTGSITVQTFVILLLLKMLATSITFGSGAVGGLFAPTLVMGALYGGAFGYGFHALMPWAVPQPELFVPLGMIVMFGSIVKGYWSGLLMIADLSGCYHQLLLPGVIAGGISFLVSWELHDKSIFGLSIEPAEQPAQSTP